MTVRLKTNSNQALTQMVNISLEARGAHLAMEPIGGWLKIRPGTNERSLLPIFGCN